MDEWFWLFTYLTGIGAGVFVFFLWDTFQQNKIEGRTQYDYRMEKLVLQHKKLEMRMDRIKRALKELKEREHRNAIREPFGDIAPEPED